MVKIIGNSTRVVDFEGLSIDELIGNVASKNDELSVAHVQISKPTAEPWLTLEYDEWMTVLKGTVELHTSEDGEKVTLQVGQTAFVAKQERFRPVFPVANTEYIAVCTPAFRPDRCQREDSEDSQVAEKLQTLHSGGGPASADNSSDLSCDHLDVIYHMCQKDIWEESIAQGEAYFPPTFQQDGYFTHASAVASRLIDTANHFYKETKGEWICIELSVSALKKLGIVTRFEEPMPVGDTVALANDTRYPHVYGGLPSHVPGVVTNTFPMKRDPQGTFLAIEGL